MNRNEVFEMVCETLGQLMDEYAIEKPNFHEDTLIYGTHEGISSLMLVRLIVDLEEAIETKSGLFVTIADEKILSARTSPFANLRNLTDFLMQLMAEQTMSA